MNRSSAAPPRHAGRAGINVKVPVINGETFFFRDHGQFDLLRLRLLPELIERRRSAKTLRLWSAGCASGEEVYSLAMLVDMLLPERDDWNIFILGSDFDETALEKARHGRYRQWSFRLMQPALIQRYFQQQGDEWILDKRICRMVTFRAGDLIGDSIPADESGSMDLILCRNVFIYFDAEDVSAVADKLVSALSEGGYLMTAHTELIGHRMRNMQSRLFAEGVVHQRVAPAPTVIPGPVHIIQQPPAATKLVPRTTNVPPLAVPGVEDMLAAARALADGGDYDQAVQVCRRVLTVAPLAPGPHFLLAQLAQLRGDFEQAAELLNKTLYLDPRSVAATLELAALCERIENLPRAQTLRRSALDIVRSLPGDSVIEPYETTAAEMAQWLAQ